MKKKEILRVFILLIMLAGVCYSIWQIIVRIQNNFVGMGTIIPILILSILGIYMYFPRKWQ
ncbi:hypothetical protein BLX88_07865 [Bacillus obstructivus]|jgi:carbon starvation protein CstA|nr:hypothetical protein BLX88_07865 [Bacillus obstructivus]